MEALIAKLNEAGVRYVVIGGQAVRLHGLPRFSMDWDLWIPPRDLENFERLNKAIGDSLGEAVIPLGDQGQNFVQTFQTRFGVLQFHLALPGVSSFEEVEAASVLWELDEGTLCRVLSVADLLQTKRAAGRAQDQIDIDFLKEKQKKKSEQMSAEPKPKA